MKACVLMLLRGLVANLQLYVFIIAHQKRFNGSFTLQFLEEIARAMYADFSSHADRSAVSKEQVSSVVNTMNVLKLKYTAIVLK